MGQISELRAAGLTWGQIADNFGLGSEASARRAYKKEQQKPTYTVSVGGPVTGNGSFIMPVPATSGYSYTQPSQPLVAPKPLNVKLPPKRKPVLTSVDQVSVLLYGDTHFPFQDDYALNVVQQIAADLQPDIIVHMGDLIDAYHLSTFDKNPTRHHDIQTEIDMARAHLASIRVQHPDAVIVYLEGNHEERLTRAMWASEGTSRALMKLTKVQDVLAIPVLLGLDELNVEWVPENEQSRHELLTKFLLKHGSVVRQKSAYTANAEYTRYGQSGASGHTHRLGAFYHTKPATGGTHVWVETGCTCIINPEYAIDPDWQQGAVVLTLDQETGAVAVEPIYIRDGQATFRGNNYNGAF